MTSYVWRKETVNLTGTWYRIWVAIKLIFLYALSGGAPMLILCILGGYTGSEHNRISLAFDQGVKYMIAPENATARLFGGAISAVVLAIVGLILKRALSGGSLDNDPSI